MEEFLRDSPDLGNNSSDRRGTDNPPNYYDNGEDMFDNNARTQDDYNSQTLSGYPTIAENGVISPHLNYSNEAGTYGSSFQNDQFLDDLESLNLPQNQFLQTSQEATPNLDELISPSNRNQNAGVPFNKAGQGSDQGYLSPQYLSPSNRMGNYNVLNSIDEGSLLGSFNNTFSPSSRNEGLGMPIRNTNYLDNYNDNFDLGSSLYLSPQINPQFMSPTNNNVMNSLDTLRSPPFNSNYLNSPPTYQNNRQNTLSTSIPSNANNKPTSSQPQAAQLGSSLPVSSSLHGSPKQLTKEEKLKRRREFHNAVERRRRDLIKERIKELGFLVPPSMLNPQLAAVQNLQKNSKLNSREINDLLVSIKVKETKPNKSIILNNAVDYIRHLRYVLDEQDKAKKDITRMIEELESRMASTSMSSTSNMPEQSSYFSPGLSGTLYLYPQNNPNVENTNDSFNPAEFFLDEISSNPVDEFNFDV